MSIPNLIPHKTLYISGYIYSYYAFVFIFEFPEHISKHILQFHTFFFTNPAQESAETTTCHEKPSLFCNALRVLRRVVRQHEIGGNRLEEAHRNQP